MSTVRVAAIQVTSIDGQVARNLANAEPFVADAAARGAELIVCPEFLGAGYVFDETIWDGAEPLGGPTERWLARLARAHRVVIGAGFLESDGDDFWNTFSMFGPDGALLGRVRKSSLPFFEGWFFRPCPTPKIIDTPMGRVAVGICNDTQTREFLAHVANEQPDIIVMPHSAPTPHLPLIGGLVRRIYDAQLVQTASRYAEALGMPTVLSNKVSTPFLMPVPLVPGLRLPLTFHGHSRVVDSDGTTGAYLEDEEGALVADVSTDATRKLSPVVGATGYWSFGPGVLSKPLGHLLRYLDALGQRSYRGNIRRRAAAQGSAATVAAARATAATR